MTLSYHRLICFTENYCILVSFYPAWNVDDSTQIDGIEGCRAHRSFFNARPENFWPKIFAAVQISFFPKYCTWALEKLQLGIGTSRDIQFWLVLAIWCYVKNSIRLSWALLYHMEIPFLLWGSSSNHDDDGNNNVTNLHIWQWKTIVLHTSHVHFSFWTFGRRSSSCTYDGKCSIMFLTSEALVQI